MTGQAQDRDERTGWTGWTLRIGDRVSVGSLRVRTHQGDRRAASGVITAFDTVPGRPGVKVALDPGQGAAASECYATYDECSLLTDGGDHE